MEKRKKKPEAKKNLTKIGQSKFTWRGNQRDKVFQFLFQILDGWTDIRLPTGARFGSMYSEQNEQGYAKTNSEQQPHFENSRR